jgi:Protein of unknown function (DUF3761)
VRDTYFGATLIAAAAVAIGGISWTAPPTSAAMQCREGYYKAASGDCVHRPVCGVSSPPPGATAQCADGCYTFSENPDEDYTCHGHGGVK